MTAFKIYTFVSFNGMCYSFQVACISALLDLLPFPNLI